VHIVDHELADNFDLLALERTYAGKGPLGVPHVGRHRSDDAGFVDGPGLAEDRLSPVLQHLTRQHRVKAEADVEVIAVWKLQLTIGGFPDRGFVA